MGGKAHTECPSLSLSLNCTPRVSRAGYKMHSHSIWGSPLLQMGRDSRAVSLFGSHPVPALSSSQQPVRCRSSAGAGDPSVQMKSANSHPWVKPAWESSALKLPQTEFQHSVTGYKHKHCCLGRPALTAELEKVQGRF